jgi:hypothetical protein
MQYARPPEIGAPIMMRGSNGFEISRKIGNQLLIQVDANAKDAEITFQRVLRLEINKYLDNLLSEYQDKIDLVRSQSMEATNFNLNPQQQKWKR